MNDHLGREIFDFLRDLRLNNDREWFQENRDRYEEYVKEPLLGFIADFAEPLREISPHFKAIPKANGGSMFRIYRDVRFSRDKSPYKTHAALHFRHEAGKDAHAPGFYIHFEPDRAFGGGGVWLPPKEALAAVRNSISDDPDGWLQACEGVDVRRSESLKRPPRGFDKAHPLIDDIKLKSFFWGVDWTEDEALEPGLLQRYAHECSRSAGFMRYLCNALGVPF